MGSNTTTTQQQSSPSPYLKEPYAPLAPYLSDIMGISSNLYGNGAGTQLWGGGANAPLDPSMADAINGWQNFNTNIQPAALQPFMTAVSGMNTNAIPQSTADWFNNLQNQFQNINAGPQNALSGLMSSGGTNPWMQQGANQANFVANMAKNPTAGDTFLTDMAAGTNQSNPFLNQLLDTNAERIANLAKSASSGAGRYGSFGMFDALNRSIAATNNPLLFQSAENERQRQLAAAQEIQNERNASLGLGLQAGQLSGNLGQMLNSNTLNAANSLGNLNLAGLTGSLNATNALANMQGENAKIQQGWGQLAPSLFNTAQAPFQSQFGLGGFLQDRAQAEQNLAMQQFQQANMMPWTQLGLYGNTFSALSPLIGQYGSGFSSSPNSTTTVSQPTPWTTLAGLGIAGGGLAGQLGAFGPTAQAALTGASFLSDARTKTDIEHIGVDPTTGLNLYAFRYANDPKHYPKIVGPMAQEVAEKYPHMVGRTDTGALYIKV